MNKYSVEPASVVIVAGNHDLQLAPSPHENNETLKADKFDLKSNPFSIRPMDVLSGCFSGSSSLDVSFNTRTTILVRKERPPSLIGANLAERRL